MLRRQPARKIYMGNNKKNELKSCRECSFSLPSLCISCLVVRFIHMLSVGATERSKLPTAGAFNFYFILSTFFIICWLSHSLFFAHFSGASADNECSNLVFNFHSMFKGSFFGVLNFVFILHHLVFQMLNREIMATTKYILRVS